MVNAFEQANESFHDAYAAARDDAGACPQLLVIGDALILHRRGTRKEVIFTAPLFHAFKAAAHMPIAAFMVLSAGPFDDERRRAANVVGERIRAAEAELRDIDASESHIVLKLLRAARDLLDTALGAEMISPEALRASARKAAPMLLQVTHLATEMQLRALDREARALLSDLEDEERRELQVVVAGDHQARARSFAMQYFEHVLGERHGEERRLTYGENISDEAEAMALVRTRRLDRAIAAAFFDDPRRLQRDVLGDAAAESLASLDFQPFA